MVLEIPTIITIEDSAMNAVASLLRPEDILLDVDVSNKLQLLDAIGWHMERLHALRHDWVTLSLSRREQVGSTGLGQGIAIPHARVQDLDRIQAAYMRLKSPIPFEAPDGKPVSDIVVLLVPKQAAEEHLRVLADATQMFADRRFRERLRRCGSPLDVKQLLEAWPGAVG